MRLKPLMFALLLLFSGAFVACDGASDGEYSGEAELEETGTAVENEWEAESAELGRDIDATRVRVDERINQLETDLETAGADARAEMEEELNELREYRTDLDRRTDRLGQNIEDGWANFRDESRRTLDNIERALDPEGDLE